MLDAFDTLFNQQQREAEDQEGIGPDPFDSLFVDQSEQGDPFAAPFQSNGGVPLPGEPTSGSQQVDSSLRFPQPSQAVVSSPIASRIENGVNSFRQGLTLPVVERLPKFIATVSNAVQKGLGLRDESFDVKQDAAWRVGENMAVLAKAMYPTHPELEEEWLAAKVPMMAGELTGAVAAGLVTGGAGAAPTVGRFGFNLGAAVFGAVNTSSRGFEEALNAGATESEAFGKFLIDIPVGALDGIQVGMMMTRFNNATNDAISSTLKRGFEGSLENLIVGSTQSFISNTAASQIYDPSRDILENVIADGLGEGAIGFAMNAIASAVGAKRLSVSSRQDAADLVEMDRYVAQTARDNGIPPPIAQQVRRPNIDYEIGGKVSPKNRAMTLEEESPADFTQNKFKQWLAPEGKLSKATFEASLRKDRAIAADLKEAELRVNSLVKQLEKDHDITKLRKTQKFFGSQDAAQIPESTVNDLDRLLRGEVRSADTVLSVESSALATDLRFHVDRLSNNLVKEGLVEGPLAATIDGNIGVYLHRTYKIHTDPKWSEKIPIEIRNRAKAHIRSEMVRDGRIGTNLEVDREIQDLLYKNQEIGEAFGSGKGKLGSQDVSTLFGKKDIHPAIRALMGEEMNPLVNYARTVGKVSDLLNNRRFLTKVRDEGLKSLFYHPDDGTRPLEYSAQFGSEDGLSFQPLGGYYTTPEIKSAFTNTVRTDTKNRLYSTYLQANAAVKRGKTVLAPTSWARNVGGGLNVALSNGHFLAPLEFKKALTRAKQSLAGGDPELSARMVELGVHDSNVFIKELEGLAKDATVVADPTDFMNVNFGMFETASGPLTNLARFTAKFITNPRRSVAFFQAQDNFVRQAMFLTEMGRYKKAVGESISQEDLEEQVAAIIRDIYPNYAKVPEAIKALRRVPLVGTFVSFPYEMLRTSWNTLNLGLRELKSDNNGIKRIGATRLAGLATGMVVTEAIAGMSRQFLGIGERQDEATALLAPEWDRFSPRFYLDKSGDTVRYINIGYFDPRSYMKDALYALVDNPDPSAGMDDRLRQSFVSMFSPFFSEEILVGKILDIARNQKDNGSWVYNPNAPDGQKIADQFAYMWNAFEPGFATNARRFWKVADGTKGFLGKPQTFEDELSGLFGFRPVEINVPLSLKFRARDFAAANRNIRSIVTGAQRDPNATVSSQVQSLSTANRQSELVFQTMSDQVQAAMDLGQSPREVIATLREARLSQDTARDLIRGRFRPIRRP